MGVSAPGLAGSRLATSWPPVLVNAPQPIRVCFLIDRLSQAGTESQLLSLLRHLDRRQVSPYLCLLDGESAESRALEPDACPVLRLGVRSLHKPTTLARAWEFVRFLRRERIDVVQVYFPDSTHFGVPLARLAGVRRVVRTRFNLGYWMTPLDRWLGRLHTQFADATMTNCEPCRQSVIESEWAKPAAVHVIENGVELAPFLTLPLPDFAAARPRRIGLVANLRPVKQPDLFVRAARLVADQYPHTEFHLAGEGELRPELEQLSASLRLQDRVKLHGRVQDIPGFLANLDLAVLCSRSEGSSNAILEYLAAGMLRFLKEPALAERLAAAGRQRVRERFDARTRARRYEAFYRGLMGAAA